MRRNLRMACFQADAESALYSNSCREFQSHSFNERSATDISISKNTYNESHKELRIPERCAHLHTFCQTVKRKSPLTILFRWVLHTLFEVET